MVGSDDLALAIVAVGSVLIVVSNSALKHLVVFGFIECFL
jgi:hypothetical protein